MIEGVVNAAYEPVVTLSVQGPSGQSQEIEAVIDTGFTGFLTVTPAMVTELGLRYRSRGWATLADGAGPARTNRALRPDQNLPKPAPRLLWCS